MLAFLACSDLLSRLQDGSGTGDQLGLKMDGFNRDFTVARQASIGLRSPFVFRYIYL